ncbi:MAG: DUF3854 domain-containing protein [Leptolyngbyaceae cyanobacterium RM1_406_9]|nr:DUF3854 domain-containing protein [Leptolyngbyaceae cyanobacterium RM1_406_9]
MTSFTVKQTTPSHVQEWQASAVDPNIILRNVWRIEDSSELDQLLNRNSDRRWKHSNELVPGWAVAGVDPKTGERSFKSAQFKPDNPPIDPDTKKPRKYFNPSKTAASPLFLEMEAKDYWQRLMFDFTAPIVLTEGAKKAGAVLSKGIPCISIPGVTTGGKLGRLRPELELFCRYGRRIYLAFDRDILNKKPVQQALHNLGRMIAAKGAMVYVLEWSNNKKGIDDYLAAGGDIAARIEEAKTLEEWRDEQEDQPSDLMEIETCRLAQRFKMVNEKLKGRVRWNNLKGEVELDNQPIDLDDLRIYLALKHNIDIPIEDCSQIVHYIAKQQLYSPVAEYLHQCAAVYSADDDLDALLSSVAKTYLGCDSELHAAFIRKTLISAVARALEPGCKVDTVCILSGRQGVGKSSFWRVLAGDWFDDSVGSVSDKDERLKLHQSWFVEWAELEAVFRRKDISAVKAFITTQTDQIRPPYGRTVKEFARPSVIVGTTNFDEFLADPTGNRRFWVVPIKTSWIPLEELANERDRIWAAATHAFLKGESWTLPAELKQQAVEAGQDYEMSDPWEEHVLNYITERERVSASEILTHAIGLEIDRQDRASQMRVSNILKANLWTTSREYVRGKRLRFWSPPSADENSADENLAENSAADGMGQPILPEVVPEVVPQNSLRIQNSLSFDQKGCPGCPEEFETQAAVVGQPMGQPMGQPTGQPPKNAETNPQNLKKRLNNPLRDNRDNQDNHFPKTSGTQELALCRPSKKTDSNFQPGDKVEILAGRFSGMRVYVKNCKPDGQVEVKHPNWAITQFYEVGQLRLLKKGGQSDANAT